MVVISLIVDWVPLIKKITEVYVNRNTNNFNNTTNTLIKLINENTDIDDKISVYGNADHIYLYANRLHATKYSYQTIGFVDETIMEDYLSQLKEEMPKVIIVQYEMYDDIIGNFLDENSYKLIWQDNETDNLRESCLFYISK